MAASALMAGAGRRYPQTLANRPIFSAPSNGSMSSASSTYSTRAVITVATALPSNRPGLNCQLVTVLTASASRPLSLSSDSTTRAAPTFPSAFTRTCTTTVPQMPESIAVLGYLTTVDRLSTGAVSAGFVPGGTSNLWSGPSVSGVLALDRQYG